MCIWHIYHSVFIIFVWDKHCIALRHIRCGAHIAWSIFFRVLTKANHYSSVRARCGVCFVSSTPALISASANVVTHIISCYIGSHYNGIPLSYNITKCRTVSLFLYNLFWQLFVVKLRLWPLSRSFMPSSSWRIVINLPMCIVLYTCYLGKWMLCSALVTCMALFLNTPWTWSIFMTIKKPFQCHCHCHCHIVLILIRQYNFLSWSRV